MKIAILSDSHENKDALKKALKTATTMGAEQVLFCGDFCGPFMVVTLGESFSGPIHAVFGNNDGDRFRMLKNAKEIPQLTFHGEYASLIIDGKRIGLTHYPFYAKAMAKSGDYDLVCFGHDHVLRIENYGSCLAVNPGTIYEEYQGKPASFAIYDTATHQAVLYDLSGSILSN